MPSEFRNVEKAKAEKLFCYGLLRNVCPRSVVPSDIDGVLDNNGNFLFFEIKTAGSTINEGQRLLIRRLVRSSPAAFIYLICDHKKGAESKDVLRIPEDLETFRAVIGVGFYGNPNAAAISRRPIDAGKLETFIRFWSDDIELATDFVCRLGFGWKSF